MVELRLSVACKVIVSLMATFATNTYADSQRVVDRAVIEINRTTYSQRQLEVFHLVRQVFDATADTSVAVIDEAQWARSLIEFQHAMLIEQEAQRLGSFRPARRSIESALEIFNKRLADDSKLRHHAQRLELGTRTLLHTATTVLRIEAFLLSKQRQGLSHREFEQTSWFREIVERSFIRYYEGAELYRQLSSIQ